MNNTSSSMQMPLDSDHFRSVLGRFATGVTVVTLRDAAGRDHGMTVSAFGSLSLSPPLILVCIDRSASMYRAMANVSAFAVNILAASQEALSRRFAKLEADERFAGIGFTRGAQGAPILDEVLAHLECRRIAEYEGGDHAIFVGAVEHALARDERPLLYYRGGYAQLER